MKLSDLQNDQQVRARCGRADRTSTRWGPWFYRKLRVERDARGEITTIAILMLDGAALEWPEYLASDFDPESKVFANNGHFLEIEDLEA